MAKQSATSPAPNLIIIWSLAGLPARGLPGIGNLSATIGIVEPGASTRGFATEKAAKLRRELGGLPEFNVAAAVIAAAASSPSQD